MDRCRDYLVSISSICCVPTVRLLQTHPICQGGQEVPQWYEGGPLLSCLHLPIPDSSRPWGSNCSECKGHCCDHFLKPMEALTSSLKPMFEPPSTVLATAFKDLKGESPPDSLIEELARKTLLPSNEVKLWFSHLQIVAENRRGAQKAAETRRLRKQQQKRTQQLAPDVYYCGVCHEQYLEYTNVVERWIGCDRCDRWYHYSCVGLTSEPESFVCMECS